MKVLAIAAAAILFTGAMSIAQGQPRPERVTVALSDPDRAGKVEIDAYRGSIAIRGTNRKDVLITARAREGRRGQRTPQPPPPGFRRLLQANGFDVSESNNVVAISTSPRGDGYDFEIEVPTRTNLDVFLVNGSDVNVRDVDGDMEVDNATGDVIMTNVAGAVVANSVKGAIKAMIARVAADKPMAFTTLTADVDVTFPAATRATFKLRSDQGNITPNFDLQLKSESTPRSEARQGKEPLKIAVNRSRIGTVNGGGPEIELRSFNGNIFLRQGK